MIEMMIKMMTKMVKMIDQDGDRAHLSCALDDDRAERLQRGKRVVSLQPGGEYYYKGDKDKRLERGYNQYHWHHNP